MTKKITLLALILGSLQLSSAQEMPVEVADVSFKSLQDDWIQMKIQVRASSNILESAKNERFVDNIKLMAYLGYVRDKKTKSFDFYKSEAEIISIEQGKTKEVHFFMPGVIIKRDRLPKEPPYYFVALEVDGRVFPLSNNAYSQSSLNKESLRSMKQKADAESEVNDFILMPYYNAPGNVLLDARLDGDDLAPLIIREPRD